ncbi:phospholipase A [Paraglaciecola aquimarina]|uniref:Phospholipase A1 n=1 Tax=Paraglaciecola aquimarina TaxID=1235557 RepID=A0ABU3SSK6_9ALTE|nr:phospholipase A [Paraglaciecola aquimarina]MDU0352975.1 phospholipase A [Paraglaciecola aquimarina]
MKTIAPSIFALTCFSAFFCHSIYAEENASILELDKAKVENADSILDEQDDSTKKALKNPFSLSQHKQNYFLPLSYASNPNSKNVPGLTSENVDNLEAKYQISVKLPLYVPSNDTTGLYFAFTAKSFWQVYNSDVSKPFRETNYEPEAFYAWQNELSILGFKFNQIQLGINHQSNGRSDQLSRSWNRIFGSVVFSDADSFYYLKAWYRIPEDPKTGPDDASGDDNPDITTYMGLAELGYGTSFGDINLLGTLRNNLRTSDNKGSIELNLTYPLTDNYDLLLQYFNGYGDSLIDYNRHQQRVSLGIQLKYF